MELAFCFGFPYADFPGCGAAIAAFADTRVRADAFLAAFAAQEAGFVQDTQPAAEAVASALRLARGVSCPVVLADTQDNPVAVATATPPACWRSWCGRARRALWSA